MVNTRGFQSVAEVTESALLDILREAWRSGSLSGTGTLPQEIQIPAGTALGPFTLADGTVRIPQEQIRLDLNPGINGFNLTLGLLIDLEIDNPPVPSAQLFNITADVTARIPLGTAPDPSAPINLALLLEGLPADAIDVVITSGDPFAAVLANGPEEYIHKLYQDGVIPQLVQDIPLSFGPVSMKASAQFFDDESDPTRRITVSFPPAQMQVDVPCYLRFYDITDTIPFVTLFESPMGTFATLRLTMPFSRTATHIHIGTDNITPDLVNFSPDAATTEGANYLTNRSRLAGLPGGLNLDNLIRTGFVTAAGTLFSGNPPVDFDIPSIADLEAQVEQFIRDEMNSRRWLIIWAPNPADLPEEFSIASITAKVLPDVLAIAFNGGPGANANLLDNFIPVPCDFAMALDDDFIEGIFQEKLNEQFPEFPVTLPPEETDGRNIRLNSLNLNLVDGAIRVTGDLTAVDVILDSIDVDVNFTINLGLRWVDQPDGSQMLEPFVIGDPDIDIDLDLLGWILAFLTGFILFGLIGAIIFVIVLAIVIEIVENIGAGKVTDALGNVTGIAAWPVDLPNIGSMSARFKNPVDIFATGVRFIGEMNPESASGAGLDEADANGPYSSSAQALIAFDGGANQPASQPQWVFGDGNFSVLRQATHRYGDSGQYVAKLRINVNQTGGATTRNFTAVRLQNVPPKVSLPATLTANEGEEVEIVGQFSDPEWLDTHIAIFDWGDNSQPTQATVSETNTPPEALGTATAKHAWCDNGAYLVRLTVIDADGGVGEATMRVTVLNVPPKVTAPAEICTLVGQPLVLKAEFEDAGWCDEHTATWDLGDCQVRDAFVETLHEPPVGRGTVEVCHEWAHCGTYLTQVIVTDDDGGSGSARTIVHAVELKNPNMEQGFRLPQRGNVGDTNRVANDWQPYAANAFTLDKEASAAPREWQFFAENMVEREGRRAQGIRFRGAVQVGILQTICANEGWDYEFTADYHLVTTRQMGRVRVGIDPNGGTDPDAPSIVWRELPDAEHWKNITVRATAQAQQITVFVGGIDRMGGQNLLFVDRTRLCQIQPTVCDCPDSEDPTDPQEPDCKRTCVDFSAFDKGTVFLPGTPSLLHEGLAFESVADMVIKQINDPAPAHNGLFFTQRGVEVTFPHDIDRCEVTVYSLGDKFDFTFLLFDDATPVGSVAATIEPKSEKTFVVDGATFNRFRIRNISVDLMLVKICYCRQPKTDAPPVVEQHGH
jgi:hypothetical protein